MRLPKTFTYALALSTLSHALLFVVPYTGHSPRKKAPKSDFVFVHLPDPVKVPKEEPVKIKRDFQKLIQRPPSKNVQPATGSLIHSDDWFLEEKEKVREDLPVSSSQLLNDPQKGRIFSRYFQEIKTRIQTIALRHQKYVLRERGKIELDFVLNRFGLIVSLDAHPNRVAAHNPLLISRAMDIINESEPFKRFPPEIQAKSISFNITLVFDGQR